MYRQKKLMVSILLFGLLFIALALATIGTTSADQPKRESEKNIYWWWDTTEPVGEAKLIRTNSGLKAVFDTSELPPGQAVTLWFIVFNNPEYCAYDPCRPPFDLFTPGVEGDFHFASGRVVGKDGEAKFKGKLKVGDTSGSGRVELGIDDGVGLIDPYKAEVLLAVHSHGPALTGQALKKQLSTFTGGCEVFLDPNNNGFANGPEDVPDAVGECSTIQFSLHQADSGDSDNSDGQDDHNDGEDSEDDLD